MSEIANLWFKIGFGFVAFIVLNFLSYAKESSNYQHALNGAIRFSGGGYGWGFPFKLYSNFLGNPGFVGFEQMPTVLNIVIAVASAGAVGIFLEFVAGKFRRHDLSPSDQI